MYSRSLCPGGVLLELVVVDGEVRSEVAAVAQWRYAAVTQADGGDDEEWKTGLLCMFKNISYEFPLHLSLYYMGMPSDWYYG